MAFLTATVGCQPQKPFYFLDDGDLSHYLGEATDIEVPDLELESLDEVNSTLPPMTLDNVDLDSVEELTLEEAMRNTLENSKVMRELGGTVGFGPQGSSGTPGTLLQNREEAINTVWDPALAESHPRYGVEGALAAFDAQFTTSMFWEKNDSPVNVGTFGEGFFSRINQQDLGTFQARISKTNATGGTTSITHNVRYEQSNSPLRMYPSDFTTNLEMEFRQPLGQGSGPQFNLISGPGAIPGFNAGVMIARLNVDISLNDFEAGVRNLVSDVERAYWNLYYAYRHLDTVRTGRDRSLRTWREVEARYRVSTDRGGAQAEAQARQQLWAFQAEWENALSNLLKTESILRYVIGLSPTDGRLFRPSDEPATAKVSFDWHEIHSEALARSVELRKQRWVVKQRQLEVISSKNYLLPRVDLVGRYRWTGLGDDLIDSNNSRSNAYGSMTDGNFQEWQFGVDFGIPLGFRKEMAGVRYSQQALAKSREVLREKELELSYQLDDAIRELHRTHKISGTHFQGLVAAIKDLEAAEVLVDKGPQAEKYPLTMVLDAQRRLAEVESRYFRSLVDYNLAITNVHFRKGSLLEYNGVYLAEGPWPGKAYFDAERRAQARDASFYLDYGFTRPKVISRGAYGQDAGREILFDSEVDFPVELAPEILPTPKPVPLQPTPAEPISGGNLDQSGKRAPSSSQEGPRLSGQSDGKTGWVKSSSPPGGRYDLANHLDVLAAGSSVKSVGFVKSKPRVAAGSVNTGKRRYSANSSEANENRESSAPAKDNSSSSGWKRAER